jgi:hypothetical protein
MSNEWVHHVWVVGVPSAVTRAKAMIGAEFLEATQDSVVPLPDSSASLLRYRYATRDSGPVVAPLKRLSEAVEGLRVTLSHYDGTCSHRGFEVFSGGTRERSCYERTDQRGALPDYYPYSSLLKLVWAEALAGAAGLSGGRPG